ncbi:DNA-binding response regulator [Clostridium tetani]|uniref:Stage 0 sporulation protein A homolog n=2 Tax=Clostridium tetani TaxID=1513 RepID=Q898N4_CLOTE|nr:response regulator transcription factor [Clostridium tetani]AAO35045.1 alkaline phosphatase synthesis transcriptional regulatory protein phoP [Clostridium tetani E88]KGI37433.1 XRE family transcriptional regulator [Clostridium tetani ATCC 9441]KGI40840.1 XRE family transcriptional regulator [Clostridium tetani]KGI44316.1 XRE family transcriptional regulator [Clostridium tetani]KHO38183.1 XRE family transcriptional regulator [Clostridium tetani]
MEHKIIVIEDEFSINDILTFALKEEGYRVKSTFSSQEARKIMKEFRPNLVLLDINLPDESGFELCKFITCKYKIPILMITARNDLVDKVLGLELGADDYITKPFHIKEVMTRVRVALRRVKKYSVVKENKEFIELNDEVKINLESREVFKNNREIKLKPKEYDLLVFLAQNRNIVFSRETILDRVWELEYDGEIRTVDIHVRRLRAKLDSNNGQSIIETVFGVGYVMR